MTLIENWRKAYKMFSVQALAVIAAAQAILAVVPADKLALHVPFTGTSYAELLVGLSIAAAVLGAVGRLIDQTSVKVE